MKQRPATLHVEVVPFLYGEFSFALDDLLK